MAFQVKIPSVGESISEVTIARRLKGDGEFVSMDEPIAEIDSDKTTLELPAERPGRIRWIAAEGSTVAVGEVIAEIDEQDVSQRGVAPERKETPREQPKQEQPAEARREEPETSASSAEPRPEKTRREPVKDPEPSPKLVSPPSRTHDGSRPVRVEAMSRLRKTIAQRLVAAKNETAMLTTFNEADMSAVIEIRNQYKDAFAERHGVKLGFLSFFVKFACEALRQWPGVNARIEGEEIVYHDYCDIGVAVSTDRGLVVPVLRNAERLTMAEIESGIGGLAEKARAGNLSMEDLKGGTFTITNGGVFGSLLSTPILNIPQSGILGLHAIQERPVARDGQIVIRPMMYLALSYDHRVIDGREAVGFLVMLKELVEDPARFMLGL